jgi:tetratricopeptide (TPR) repeat protein
MDDINSILNELRKTALDNLFTKDYDSAIADLKKAEMIDRDNPEILFNLGISYSRKGLYKTASEYFQRVLSLKFSFIDSVIVKKNIAFCYIKNQCFNDALKILDEILSDFESDIISLNMKGYCLEKKGELKNALMTYRKIFHYDKSNINSLTSASYLMAALNIELKSALKIAKFVYQKDKSNPAYNDTLGYVYLKSGNIKEAEKFIKKASVMLPFNSEISSHIKELEILKKS